MKTINEQSIKESVQDKYGEIAEKIRTDGSGGCCGAAGCEIDFMADDYSKLPGYAAEANLGLGCGLPTEFAKIKAGDTVIDLGSGAGNDAFVARTSVGENGKIIGIDFTEKMIVLARQNAEKLKYANVEFRLGDLEDLPVYDTMADVVVSNCVFNLVPNKAQAFQETFRVLKPGGHFSISDIVIEGALPDELKKEIELYAGCIAGAIGKMDYLDIIYQTGFRRLSIQKERVINIPDEMLTRFLNQDQIQSYKDNGAKIVSITVYGEKPNPSAELEKKSCCGPTCCN